MTIHRQKCATQVAYEHLAIVFAAELAAPFRASARHCNFTHAATELCVTQGAVSQQVKRLEQWLDRPLFLRTPRALVLTPEGERLRFVLRESFQAIEGTPHPVAQAARGRPDRVELRAVVRHALADPRLGDFFRDHPEVGLRVYGEFHALDRTRMVREGIDAAVRFVTWAAMTTSRPRLFLDEWLLPVASPGFLAAHPDLRGPQDLKGARLLHDASPWDGAQAFEEWRHWLRGGGWNWRRPGWRPASASTCPSSPWARAGRPGRRDGPFGAGARRYRGWPPGRPVRHPCALAGVLFFVSAHGQTPHIAMVEDWLAAEARVSSAARAKVLDIRARGVKATGR
ncbi:LysR family transcriptional regulator [Cupriavidus basilensis]